MRNKNVLAIWISWQFYEAPGFLFKAWNNYMKFAENFFSVGLLLKTFFAPWRGYNWQYPKGFDVVEFFNSLISNTFSRILGALMRTVLIVIGVLFQIFVALAGLAVFIFWILVPFIIIAGLFFVFAL